MPEIDLLVLIYVVPVMMLAGWAHGALGLGFPMIATPVIAIFIDVKLAILITLLPTAIVNIASIVTSSNVRGVVTKFSWLIAMSLLGAIVGAAVIAVTDPSPFRLVLAALIILFLFTSHFKWQVKIKSQTSAMVVFGLLAGLAGGTTNVMVGVLIVYFLSINAERSESVPAMNFCFLVGKLSQIAVFMFAGLINLQWLIYTAPLALVAYVSLTVGQKFGKTVPVERYRLILRYILILLAVVLVVQYFIAR